MVDIIITALKLAPPVLQAGGAIVDFIRGRKQRKEEEKQREQRVKEARAEFDNRIRQLDNQKHQYERLNEDYRNKIYDLEQQIRMNNEEMNRRELERQQQLLKKEQEEREAKLKQIEEEKEAIKKCKEALDNHFAQSVIEIVGNFSQEEENWINNLDEPEIKFKINLLKEHLDILFDKLFESENIMKKINNKFLQILKSNVNHIELEKMNFIVIGTSGVGKSTLINEIFGERLAIEGSGKRTTTESKKYESKLVPFISLLDTVGTEIGSGHKLIDVLKETLEEIMKKLDNNDPNEHIHCIIYCTSSNRFFKDELDVILTIRKKYDGNKLPIVIVYTRGVKEKEVNDAKKTINEFLNKFDEKISDDIFGITFIPVNSREEEFNHFGTILYTPCFGLPNLMRTCFQKGEHSYRFAIKNSLIQIGKRSIKEYLDNMHSQLVNNINYFHYLYQQFDPNFFDYIAFCFQKITDIDKQKGITKKELAKLNNYLEEHHINTEQGLSTVKCMVCDKIPKNPYKCRFCNSEVCEACFLDKKESDGYFPCSNCYQGKFVDNNNNKIIQNKKDYNKLDLLPGYSYGSGGLSENFGKESDDNNYNQINENNNMSKGYCMICKNIPTNPYKCNSCEYEVCEQCFLKQYQDEDFEKYQCGNCGNDDFTKKEENVINEIKNEIKDEDNNNYNQKKENKNKPNPKCMFCKKRPINAYKCQSCEFKVCENCLLTQIEENDKCTCENCGKDEFDKIENEDIDIFNENKINNEDIDENEKSDDNEDEDGDNYLHILNNKLNLESNEEIKKYVKEFRDEIIEVINEKFNEFAKKAANDIYFNVLEKYRDLKDENLKMDKMKDKDELKAEATQEINKALKEKAVENFLAKIASQFFQDIVLKFKDKCEEKLNNFINNLLYNEEANEFFKSCDELNGNKKFKFEDDLKEYLEKLQTKEEESLKKSLNFQEQSKKNRMGNNECGSSVPISNSSEQNCCSSESNCNSSEPNCSSQSQF